MSHILVVDDDQDLREAIQSFLEEEGYQVMTAYDGADALEMLARGDPPDVAVIDFYMPVMDGLELINRMRGEPRLASIPIIMISAAKPIPNPPATTAISKVGMREPLLREIERLSRPRAPAQ